MNPLNLIRSGIFLIAGLVAIIFTDQILKIQEIITKKYHINYKDNKRTLKMFGVLFLIISAILFIVALFQ